MDIQQKQKMVAQFVMDNHGILRLSPAWVARTFLAGGKRLGLPTEAYEAGERGIIAERWLGATTHADNAIGPQDEGLCYLVEGSSKLITLKEAVDVAGEAITGRKYAATHPGLYRLAKIFDYVDRLPYHIHQMQDDAALVGRNPKEEAYYFPEGVDLGAHPETYFGVHPYIVAGKKFDILLPYLRDWNSDGILKHARAYKQVPGEGFHLPAGVPHAPGTALTIELQEDSDVFSMMQAFVGGKIIDKGLLYKDVRPEDREKYGEAAVLKQINWQIAGDPYFYENRHTEPILIQESVQPGGEEYWIFYNTNKFSGKKLVIKPGKTYTTMDKGVYNILVWRGKGRYGGVAVEAGKFDLERCSDELLIVHDRAIKPLFVENTGEDEMVVFKFFGPDINPDAPMIPAYPAR